MTIAHDRAAALGPDFLIPDPVWRCGSGMEDRAAERAGLWGQTFRLDFYEVQLLAITPTAVSGFRWRGLAVLEAAGPSKSGIADSSITIKGCRSACLRGDKKTGRLHDAYAQVRQSSCR